MSYAASSGPNKLYSECQFQVHGATKEFCEETSKIFARQQRACNACKCPWKKKIGDTKKPIAPRTDFVDSPIIPRKAVMLELAQKRQIKQSAVVVPLATPAVHTTDEPWRAILNRIKFAVDNAERIQLSPARFRAQPGQPRKDASAELLTSLGKSMQDMGQLQTGLSRSVPKDKNGADHEMLDGHRRLVIAHRIPLPLFKAENITIDDEAAPYVVSAISNVQRQDHTPLEQIDIIHKLHTLLGAPLEVVAEMMGHEMTWAEGMLTLGQKLHPEVLALLDPLKNKDGHLTLGAAHKLKVLRPVLQISLAKRFVAGEIALDELREEIVATADKFGVPVRTRELQPHNNIEPAVALTKKLQDLAQALDKQIKKVGFTASLGATSEKKIDELQGALTDAENKIVLCRASINNALKRR